jgi:intracellular septation protein A
MVSFRLDLATKKELIECSLFRRSRLFKLKKTKRIENLSTHITGDEASYRRLIDSVAPVAIFLLLNRFAGLGWAVGGATVWGIQAAVRRSLRGEAVGKFLPLLIVYLLVRGLIGIITDSEDVYFGIGIATKAAIGLGLIATVLFKRSFLSQILPAVLPFKKETIKHEIFSRVMSQMTVLLGIYQILTSIWDVWLYRHTSVDGYVVIRSLVGFPAGFVASLIALLYIDRSLRKADGFEGFVDLLEVEEK